MAMIVALACVGCAARRDLPPDVVRHPRVMPAGAIDFSKARRIVDLDSLAASMVARADTLPVAALTELEVEIRDWLSRLEYEDPELIPLDEPSSRAWFRRPRGVLLDALGWSAFRRGDRRQAEAALTSAIDEVHSRGVTEGYALHFYHMGEVQAARGRWAAAVESYLDAEVRGMGPEATPALESAFRRRYGSLRGLEAARARVRARVEDERRQSLVQGAELQRLPAFTWPRRTGAPMASRELLGRTSVIAVWDGACEGCEGFAARLGPLADALTARGGQLVGVWLGDPGAAGPPLRFPLLVPRAPEDARRLLGAYRLPAILVVDAAGRVRYRHAAPAAVPPPVGDLLIQFDHLRRTVPERRP